MACRLENASCTSEDGTMYDGVSQSQRASCALAGAEESCLRLPRFRASQASSSSSSVATGVGGSSSEDAEVADDPLFDRDVAGLLELEASGAKTLSIAGWLCSSQHASRSV